VTVFGVHLLGLDAHTGVKVGFTVVAIVVYVVLRRFAGAIFGRVVKPGAATRASFWTRQLTGMALLVLLVIALVSVWFDNPARLATVAGLFTAGVAFALQRVITAFAAYIVILRGSTFSVGDRIVMGGVRGDVIALDPFQTTILEMGETPAEQADAPAAWVHSRQFTGRIVTVNNGMIFDLPVYNYTRDFPYLWDEIHMPIPYDADDARAEAIVLEAARRHAVRPQQIADDQRRLLQDRYGLAAAQLEPHTYYRLTDNWIEITVRFLVPDHGTRAAKDKMYREILAAFREANISVASGTYAIVQVPPIRLESAPPLSP
jgi:small-conductance mechanosensitive channel